MSTGKNKNNVLFFRKDGILLKLLIFYGDEEVEIVTSFSYLGIVFTPGCSFLWCPKNVITTGPERNI